MPDFQRHTARCPPGKAAIGCGAEAQGNDAILVGSFPMDGADGWTGPGRQPRYSTVGIPVYVICAYR
ncbi:hypothetical protein [Streptomyces achromogenes]|uniref:hypothetical protein n=1 Tax=Streptomyces achromogenes TaxID=67255 RepID=UPI0034234EB9